MRRKYSRSDPLRLLDIDVDFVAGSLCDGAGLRGEQASPANRKYATHTNKLKELVPSRLPKPL